MKNITKLMINEYKIKQIGCDFMGYSLQKGDIYTFHHLIVPHRSCHDLGLGEGYFKWNGAILFTTPHEYLHLIEKVNFDMFCNITSEMIDENVKGHLDINNIRRIHDILTQFEKENCSKRDKKGKILIKEQFTRRKKV